MSTAYSPASKRRATLATESIADAEGARWTCVLPPHCVVHPKTFATVRAYEEHYHLEHAHVCTQPVPASRDDRDDGLGEEWEGCGGRSRGGDRRARPCGHVFPSAWLLEGHIDEVHSALTQTRREKGLPTLHCLEPTCPNLFHTPKERRAHAIHTHAYPPTFYFDIIKHGIGHLIRTHGPGFSLLVGGGGEDQREGRCEVAPTEDRGQDGAVTASLSSPKEGKGGQNGRPTSDDGRKRTRSISEDEEDGLESSSLRGGETRIDSPTTTTRATMRRITEDDVGSAGLADELSALSLVPDIVRRRPRRTED